VVAVGLHGREIRTGQVQPGEMYQFGGANTLRGYRENQFIGSEIVWSNAEYRFLLARRSFLFAFLDTGYYNRPADDVLGTPSARAFKYGYGIGIRLDTPLGNMGVSFAFGQGDSFGTAKIHIGLINDF
jgi:outer membrane protein insertion porin family